MNSKVYLPIIFLAFTFFSCSNVMEDRSKRVTATVNGEEWIFFDTEIIRSGDEIKLQSQGYLGGDEATEPMNLQITIVGVPEQQELETPVEAFFAPTSQGPSAKATIIPVNEPLVFNTELDANADGRVTITEADGNALSGTFNFVATDQGGRSLEVTNGSFNDLTY